MTDLSAMIEPIEIPRRPDGSIDIAHFVVRTRIARSDAAVALTAWPFKQAARAIGELAASLAGHLRVATRLVSAVPR